MSRDKASLLDINHAGQLVLQFAEGLTREDLESDLVKRSAILYQIEVMGEATKRLSREFRDAHPDIPWKDFTGIRDVIIHQYDKIRLDVVWDAIRIDVPEYLDAIAPLVPVRDS
ncbi:DUF86 domain-containing protein [Spirulina sp. 06S082]|uniref:HepT-like ribonuclease domain-containing protein n=1 Tax=Spirulina sp. 06S082 TaxID=3110248 RepID=UPI002B1F3CAD|nr:DUF86 domain-containing protein [Spirulina sp. 06S082]MEA5467682.1 DUF86 domain-containing protein [Spirulina sp. 06S082]